jgi:hypothetical protein
VALRAGSGGDPLGLGRAGPAPSLHRMSLGPLPEEAMTRLLRARTGGTSTIPSCAGSTVSRKGTRCSPSRSPGPFPGREPGRHPASRSPSPRTSRSCSGHGSPRCRRAPPMGSSIVAAAARPTEDLVAAAAARRERASAGIERAEKAGILQRAGGRVGFTHPLLGSTVYAAATQQARRSVHRRLADLVVDPEEQARHLALATSGPPPPGGTGAGGGGPARVGAGSPGRRRRPAGAGPEADTARGRHRPAPTKRRGGRVPLRRRRRDPRDGVAGRGDRHDASRP